MRYARIIKREKAEAAEKEAAEQARLTAKDEAQAAYGEIGAFNKIRTTFTGQGMSFGQNKDLTAEEYKELKTIYEDMTNC